MVFLVLAAQYESWSLPLAVILVVPMCLLSAVTGVSAVPLGFQSLAAGAKGLAAGAGHISPVAQGWFAGAGQYLISTAGGTTAQIEINIFTQIGFVVLVGLASKNAILIVEFAKRQRAEGLSRREAALAACKLRLRPIVMTSMSFVLGVSTLLLAHGADCEMRRTLGTAVFSGMLGVTLFGLVLTPSFFCLIDWLGSARLFGPRWLGAPAVRLAGEVVLATVVLSFALAPILLPLIDRLLGPRLWYGVARLVESGRFTPASARTTLEISLLMGVLAFAVTVIRLGLWQVRRPPAPRKEQD
jgi:multidrug efflux pump